MEVIALIVQRSCKKNIVDERMNDDGIAAIVGTNAVAHEARVGDEARHSLRRGDVPLSQPRGKRTGKSALQATRKVVIETVPDVAHRRVAVADVRLAAAVDAFRHGMAGADDEIESAEVPPLHGTRKERQERAVVRDARGNRLQC